MGFLSSESCSRQGQPSGCPSNRPQSMSFMSRDKIVSLPAHVCLVRLVLPSSSDCPTDLPLKFHIGKCWLITLAVAHELTSNLQHPTTLRPRIIDHQLSWSWVRRKTVYVQASPKSFMNTPCGGGASVFSAKKTTLYLNCPFVKAVRIKFLAPSLHADETCSFVWGSEARIIACLHSRTTQILERSDPTDTHNRDTQRKFLSWWPRKVTVLVFLMKCYFCYQLWFTLFDMESFSFGE